MIKLESLLKACKIFTEQYNHKKKHIETTGRYHRGKEICQFCIAASKYRTMCKIKLVVKTLETTSVSKYA